MKNILSERKTWLLPLRLRGRLLTVFILAAVLHCVSLAVFTRAAKIHPEAGSTSAAFLKLGAGARAAAMGGAFTGVPGDPFSIYWNPAGLAYAGKEKTIGFFHNEYFQGLGQEYLAYTSPYRAGALGLGLNYFYTPGDLERRSGLNESDAASPISPSEGKFGASDLAFSMGYGQRYPGDYSLGAAVKVIRQSIDNRSGVSAALDLGLLREFSWRGGDYTAGFSVQNIGPGIKFLERRYPLPLVFKAGVSRLLDDRGALISLEADKPADNYPSVTAGIEYPLTGRLMLRSGYKYRIYGNELGAWSGFSAGAGVAFDRLTFDYAFTPFGVLGNSHRFSINLRFGAAPREAGPGAGPAAAAVPAPDGFRNFAFKVSPRPLTLSTRGVRYEIKAVSDSCGISAMTFRTMLRSEAPGDFSMAEGAPSGALLAGFPEGVLPLKVWRTGGLPGSVQGDIYFEFRVPKTVPETGRTVFMYRKGGKWEEVPSVPAEAEPDYYIFSAAAPLSSDYALALQP